MNKTASSQDVGDQRRRAQPACHLTGEDHHARVKGTTVLQLPIYQCVAPTQRASILGHCSYHHSPSQMVSSTVGQRTGPRGSCMLQHHMLQCCIDKQAIQSHHTACPSSIISESGHLHLETPTGSWKPNIKVCIRLMLLLPPTRENN